MKKIYLKGIATKADNGNYRVLASTDAIDRQGDIVDQNGWELENFLKNPVILWAHRYDELPVGKAVSIGKTTQGLEMEFEFATAEGNPKAEQVKNLFEGGFLNAVSVGFIPKERNGNIIIRAELLEVSIVPVPANQEALRLAMEKGISVSEIEKDIEEGEKIEEGEESKGEVQDILDEQAKAEAKWENCEDVFDTLSAFYTAYFDPNTPVESFGTLLGEAITILNSIAGGTYVNEDNEEAKAIKKEMATKFIDMLVAKEGRVLSKKNKELISNCKETMLSGVAVLEELLKATDSSESGDGKGTEAVVEKQDEGEESVKLSVDDLLGLVRQHSRVADKANESVLGIVGKFLEARNKK